MADIIFVRFFTESLNHITSIGPKHIHKVNFYPSDNNFTQALLVMLVTNIISGWLAFCFKQTIVPLRNLCMKDFTDNS